MATATLPLASTSPIMVITGASWRSRSVTWNTAIALIGVIDGGTIDVVVVVDIAVVVVAILSSFVGRESSPPSSY